MKKGEDSVQRVIASMTATDSFLVRGFFKIVNWHTATNFLAKISDVVPAYRRSQLRIKEKKVDEVL